MKKKIKTMINLNEIKTRIRTNPMPNRTACTVLDEIRACFKTCNFSPVLGLVEELQSIFNRMESSLYDKKDIEYYTKQCSSLKKEVNELEDKKEELEEAIKILEKKTNHE